MPLLGRRAGRPQSRLPCRCSLSRLQARVLLRSPPPTNASWWSHGRPGGQGFHCGRLRGPHSVQCVSLCGDERAGRPTEPPSRLHWLTAGPSLLAQQNPWRRAAGAQRTAPVIHPARRVCVDNTPFC